jgi:hypothetical protein
MNSTVLLQKLLAIERSVGVATNNALRNQLQDAQDYVLQMQRKRVEGFWKEPDAIQSSESTFVSRFVRNAGQNRRECDTQAQPMRTNVTQLTVRTAGRPIDRDVHHRATSLMSDKIPLTFPIGVNQRTP